MKYWLAVGGETWGPFPAEEIQGLLRQGRITPETPTMPEGADEWTPLSSLIDLGPAAAHGTPLAPSAAARPMPSLQPQGPLSGVPPTTTSPQPGFGPHPAPVIRQTSSTGILVTMVVLVPVLAIIGYVIYANVSTARKQDEEKQAAVRAAAAEFAEREAVLQALSNAGAVITSEPFTINLSANPTDDRAIELLSGMTDLTELHLGGGPISDRGMQHLSSLTGLRELTIGTKVSPTPAIPDLPAERTPAGEAPAPRTPPPGRAPLRSTAQLEITDGGILHLENLERLERLELWNVAVTDAGLAALGRLTRLRNLTLAECPVTEPATRAFQKAHPTISLTVIPLEPDPAPDPESEAE